MHQWQVTAVRARQTQIKHIYFLIFGFTAKDCGPASLNPPCTQLSRWEEIGVPGENRRALTYSLFTREQGWSQTETLLLRIEPMTLKVKGKLSIVITLPPKPLYMRKGWVKNQQSKIRHYSCRAEACLLQINAIVSALNSCRHS